MKKLAVLSIALLMLTTLVFAEVMVEPTVEFSGSGTLTWGIDLDTTANHGFSNSASANLTVTLVPASTETKGGAEGDTVFGFISLSDMSVILDSDATGSLLTDLTRETTTVDLDGDAATTDAYVTAPDDDTVSFASPFVTAPTVEAYVMLGPAKWFIYGAPDLAITFAAQLEDDADADYWAEDDESDGVAPDFGAGATGVEFAAGPVTLAVLLASASDWTTGPAAYGIGVTANLAVGPATVDAAMNYPFAAGSAFGVGVKLGLALDPLAVAAAFDMTTATGSPMEITGGVTLTLPDLLALTANLAFGTSGGVATWGLDTEVGVTLNAVPGLTFSTLIGLWDLTTALEWGVKVDFAYKVAMGETNHITPGVTAYISTASEAGADELRVALIGTVTAVLIPNTTFVLTFTDKDLTDSNAFAGTDKTLTFATTVEY